MRTRSIRVMALCALIAVSQQHSASAQAEESQDPVIAITPTTSHRQMTKSMAIRYAARTVGVKARILRAILAVERGRIGQTRSDSNGSADLGPAQINTVNLPYLRTKGLTRDAIRDTWKGNILAEAYLLRRAIRSGGCIWNGVGLYHSATHRLQVAYATKIWAHLR